MSEAQVTSCAAPATPSTTLREQIAEQEKYAHAKLARLEAAKTKLPAAWLEMTDKQIHEKFGVTIYF